MGHFKKDWTQLLTHSSYVFLALTYRYVVTGPQWVKPKDCQKVPHISPSLAVSAKVDSDMNTSKHFVKYCHYYWQCWKFPQVRWPEADNFGGGPGTFSWFFFNFMFVICDSRHEDLQIFWLSFKHWLLMILFWDNQIMSDVLKFIVAAATATVWLLSIFWRKLTMFSGLSVDIFCQGSTGPDHVNFLGS